MRTVGGVISYLSGRALAADTVLVGGVGYEVFTPAPLPVGQDVELWVRTVVRETEFSLYGFTSLEERALFTCLTRVTGVGPKVALTVLGLGAKDVAHAVVRQDPKVLSRAAGIGPAKAKQILASLKVPQDVLEALIGSPAVVAPTERDSVGDDLLDTLVGLGHPLQGATDALAHARGALPDGPDPLVLRAALKALAQGPARRAG